MDLGVTTESYKNVMLFENGSAFLLLHRGRGRGGEDWYFL